MGLPLDQEQKSKFGSASVSEIELSGKLVADWTAVVDWLRRLELLRAAGVARLIAHL
jgi:hypothetical protein